MHSEPLPAASGAPPSAAFLALKGFHEPGRGPWADVPEADWSDWRWQLKHRITTLEQLEKLLPTLTASERAGATLARSKLAMAITPYFFNLIDPDDEDCPIRRQVVPRMEETHTAHQQLVHEGLHDLRVVVDVVPRNYG